MMTAEGTVKGEACAIGGLVFWPVGKDGELWRLHSWGGGGGRAAMQAMYWAETLAGICEHATLGDFGKEWDAGKWEPAAGFSLCREHLVWLREICGEGKDGSVEEHAGSGSTDGCIISWGMHGTNGNTGCNPPGADAAAEPVWV